MAEQPFQPSRFPDGELHLHIAAVDLAHLQDTYSASFADHINAQLHHLETHIADAMASSEATVRLAAITAALDRVEKLQRDNALNHWHTTALTNQVERQLERAAAAIEDN